jgi:hypothetical protein
VSSLERWLVRVRSEEDPTKPSTWKLDALWREACTELTEAEFIADTRRQQGRPVPDNVQRLLALVQRDLRGA